MQRKRDGKFVLIDFGVAKRLMETGKPGTKVGTQQTPPPPHRRPNQHELLQLRRGTGLSNR
ncbi:MAG: hypothetical protein GDA38_24210 [Hormoscilla sp. SP12CHS1]|nr:hypothetical protein [Hormoscilla sp. SP12CHS1]